jgi:predicted nucleic acid-binding protein
VQSVRVYVDTNIFIRAFEGALDDAIAQELVELFSISGSKALQAFVTSQMTLAEMLVHPIRTNDLTRQLQYKALLSAFSNWLRIGPVNRTVLIDAAALRASQKLKLPDAIHLATAERSGCSHFLTEDGDFGEKSLAPTAENLALLRQWLSP